MNHMMGRLHDGDLDPFMDAYLQWKLAQRNPQ